jgi:hypothetical protein
LPANGEFYTAKQLLLGKKQVLFGRKQVFPGRKQVFPGRKQVFPGRKQVLLGRKQVLFGETQLLFDRNRLLFRGTWLLNSHYPVPKGRKNLLFTKKRPKKEVFYFNYKPNWPRANSLDESSCTIS